MKTTVRDWDKTALARKVFRMHFEEGWEPLTPIFTEDKGFHHGTLTYACVMKHPEKKLKAKRKFNG